MKIHQWVVCAVGLAVPAGLATAQVTGDANGSWHRSNDVATNVDAVMTTDGASTPAFRLHATLFGSGAGRVVGTVEKMKTAVAVNSPPNFVYTVLGDWIDPGDGSLYMHSQLMLDLAQFGMTGMLEAGALDGRLDGAGHLVPLKQGDDYFPIPPSEPHAHVHGLGGVASTDVLGAIESTPKPVIYGPIEPTPKPSAASHSVGDPMTPWRVVGSTEGTPKPVIYGPIEPTPKESAQGKFQGDWVLF